MLIELLNPKNDYVFKRIFGHIGNENITKQMLNSIIKIPIKNIKINPSTILEKDLLNDKVGIVDIYAKLNNEIDVDIEMQVVNQKNIEKRLLFYWSKLYTRGIREGKNYNKLHKTIAILIADFEMNKLKEINKFCTKWQIREEEYKSVILTDDLELYILELPKGNKNGIRMEQQLKPWLNFFENPKDMEMVDMSSKNTIAVKEAKKVLEQISQDEREQYLAHLREKYILDQKAIEEFGYDNGLEDGLKQGIEKGLQDGLKRGLEQGLEDGLRQRTIEIAKEMLKQKCTIDFIITVTGLTKEEIENL